MRVNSSPFSLIGPLASYHVSAQLPLREHPQKPRADVPTRALQEEVLLWVPLGMEDALGSHSPHRGSVLAPSPFPLPLQKVRHEKVLISSINLLYLYYCS